MTVEILTGDALDRMREMPADSVHCCVTSPPYWGLRDYGAAGQIGLEPTPDEWCARLVEVFREVRRVLRQDGTLWLNVGDSYGGGGSTGRNDADTIRAIDAGSGRRPNAMAYGDNDRGGRSPRPRVANLKAKDLVGQPWLLAFALRADGWWLRSEIIWNKPNPMPESVRDRPTKSHEQVFLLTKRERYFWDPEAIREPHQPSSLARVAQNNGHPVWNGERERGYPGNPQTLDINKLVPAGGRNVRSVWTIATEPYSEAHFATFPSELARRCILAGTSAKGCCPDCGAPWVRVVERVSDGARCVSISEGSIKALALHGEAAMRRGPGTTFSNNPKLRVPGSVATGWRPSCSCPPTEPVPCTVLDCFGGAGTTGLAADQLGRDAILIELNPEYAAMSRRRIDGARARRLIGDASDRPPVLPGQMEIAL